MKSPFNNHPILLLLALSVSVVLWVIIFYVPIAIGQSDPIGVSVQAENSEWTEVEKWVGRIMIFAAFVALLSGFIVYVFKGRNWDELRKAIEVKDELITSLTQQMSILTVSCNETENKLKTSRDIRMRQRKIIFRLTARLEGDGKEFDDIFNEANIDDNFDFVHKKPK